jgi:PAS domain S-box-containing protein
LTKINARRDASWACQCFSHRSRIAAVTSERVFNVMGYWANLPADQVQRVTPMASHPKRPRVRQPIDESKLEAILNSAVAAIITIDTLGVIQTVNPATERLFGYKAEELLGQNVRILMPSPYHEEHDAYLTNYIKTGRKKIIGIGREVKGQRKDGTIFPVDLAVSEFVADDVRYFAGIISDLSERRRLEEAFLESERKLATAQRLDAIGQLTGGIAHDVNNLLTVITGNLELLEGRTNDPGLQELVKEAQEAADLGAQLTDRLLTFARRRHLEVEILHLNEVVLKTTSLLRRTLGEQITLSTILETNLWPTKSDPGQIESAIVNLALNARDAMPKGGKLTIETGNVTIEHDGMERLRHPDLRPGDYVEISVSDTGTGMTAEVQQRAFEPFFTTKSRGHGTGLGLSMIHGFARQSGGDVSIYSEEGHGTTVRLYLPRLEGSDPVAETKAAKESRRSTGERILVVEDDDRVRSLTVKRLSELGYEVLQAPDGVTAINMLEDGLRVDLVFTDVIMPGGVSGFDVVRRALELDPQTKAVVTSGYTEDIAIDQGQAVGPTVRLLRKPYRQAELKQTIGEVLGL